MTRKMEEKIQGGGGSGGGGGRGGISELVMHNMVCLVSSSFPFLKTADFQQKRDGQIRL